MWDEVARCGSVHMQSASTDIRTEVCNFVRSLPAITLQKQTQKSYLHVFPWTFMAEALLLLFFHRARIWHNYQMQVLVLV